MKKMAMSKEERKAYGKKYREEHKEKAKEYSKKYYKNNKRHPRGCLFFIWKFTRGGNLSPEPFMSEM